MSPGAALVEQESCLACHALGEAGERTGPRLEYIGARRSAQYVADYLVDPQKVTPGTTMPAYPQLGEPQRRALAEFIVTLASSRRETP
jgi:cbb3-type cytochrome oxidase cytochrome c subunit